TVYADGFADSPYRNLKLDEAADNSFALNACDGAVADVVTVKRTLKAGSWNTFASPVAIDADQLAALGITAVKQLGTSSFSEGVLTLNFTDATAIEAGKPYLVKVSADKEIGAFDGATVSGTTTATETTAADFIPTLGKTLVTGPAGDESNAQSVLFLTSYESKSYLIYPSVVNEQENPNSYLKGFRAYFQLKGDAQNVKSYTINFDDGETGIGEIHNSQFTIHNEDGTWYDLQGRRVNSTAHKGVFIVNGKKVIK
ncbi:MAG: hypothetical protein IK144_07285, partial [Bacteroidaceae bacterium]|nr:hypothetical protein [Bacteroidaceae bacterium]